jgi:ElaB/YqjD/DUF883 family membrane-anchored ribosome-binding protein
LLWQGWFFEADKGGGSSPDPEPDSDTQDPSTDDGKNPDPKDEDDSSQGKVFTQSELNAIVRDRLAREKSKYEDYEEAKKAQAELAKIKDSQKTTEEKLKDEADKAKQEAAEKSAKANERLIRAEIISQASALGFEHPEDAYKLMSRSEVNLDEDTLEVSGVKESLEALAKERPSMVKKPSRKKDPGETTNPDSQSPSETDDERRARIYGTGGASFLNPANAKTHGGGVMFDPSINPKQESPSSEGE